MSKMDRVQNIVNRIKYKPDFHIEVYYDYHDCIQIRGVMKNRPDADKPEAQAGPLLSVHRIPYETVEQMSDAMIIRVCLDLIRRMEMHEIDEWLKVDDKRVTNPHPDLRKEDTYEDS